MSQAKPIRVLLAKVEAGFHAEILTPVSCVPPT